MVRGRRLFEVDVVGKASLDTRDEGDNPGEVLVVPGAEDVVTIVTITWLTVLVSVRFMTDSSVTVVVVA